MLFPRRRFTFSPDDFLDTAARSAGPVTGPVADLALDTPDGTPRLDVPGRFEMATGRRSVQPGVLGALLGDEAPPVEDLMSVGVIPETERVVDPPATIAVAPKPVQLDLRSLGARPQYDHAREKRANLAALLAASGGALEATFTGEAGPLAAAARGVIGGAQAEVAGMKESFATGQARYAEAVRKLAVEQARLDNDFAGRQHEVQRDVYRETNTNARNDADNKASMERTLVGEMQQVYDQALEMGDGEGAARAAEALGLDPASARAFAGQVKARIVAEEARKGRALTLDERQVVVSEMNARTNQFSAQTSRINALKPTASSTASKGETPDEWLYKERNRLFRLRNGGDMMQTEYERALARAEAEADRRRGGGEPETSLSLEAFDRSPAFNDIVGQIEAARTPQQKVSLIQQARASIDGSGLSPGEKEAAKRALARRLRG